MESKKTRQPIQVWSPLIFKSIFDDDTRRDFSRAEKFYNNEDFVWLSPEATKIVKWEERSKKQKTHHMLVPSETINKITVYHVDKFSNVFPPIANFKELKSSLYLEWLKSESKSRKSNPIKIPFPKASEPGAYYKKIELRPIISYKKIHDTKNLFPKKIKKSSISLETEDFLYFFKDKKLSNDRTIWPKPFNSFFPTGGGLDLIYYFYLMQRYLVFWHQGNSYVLNLVKNLNNAFLTDGESTIEKSWYNPKKATYRVIGLVSEIASELRLSFNTIEEIDSSEAFMKKIKEKVTIKRAYSWLGYFLWEFYQDLHGFKITKYCENCGSIIFDCRKNQLYCREEENPDCWKSRAALRQKKKYDMDKKNLNNKK